jgi:hypothetical protein
MVEKTSYGTLLYRKTKTLRILESMVFLVGIVVVWRLFPLRSTGFVAGVIADVLIALFLTPAIYLILLRPRYALYQDRLLVRHGKKETIFPLKEMEQEFGLPYVYLVRRTKVIILASNAFLDQLNGQLEVVKRGWT